jgi:hypothetical protein
MLIGLNDEVDPARKQGNADRFHTVVRQLFNELFLRHSRRTVPGIHSDDYATGVSGMSGECADDDARRQKNTKYLHADLIANHIGLGAIIYRRQSGRRGGRWMGVRSNLLMLSALQRMPPTQKQTNCWALPAMRYDL